MFAILNKQPKTWSGRIVNIGLYKDDRLFVFEPSVGVGNYAQLTVDNKLYFAVLIRSDTTERFSPGKMFIPHFIGTPSLPKAIRAAGVANVTPSSLYPEALNAQISQLKEVDLTAFPNGVTVVLTESKVTGGFQFSAKSSQ